MVLITLLASNAYAETKPYKVCPEVVTAKDTPCKVATPTAAIVHRIEKEDARDKEIRELKARIKFLEELAEGYLSALQSK